MPRSLNALPQFAPIVDNNGLITIFFRRVWAAVMYGWTRVPAAGSNGQAGLTAAITTTTILTPDSDGFVRVGYYLRKTVADGVSSSLTFTVGWTQGGQAFSFSFSALTTDTATAEQDGIKAIYCDAASAVTFAVAYASNTPNTMTYTSQVIAEQITG